LIMRLAPADAAPVSCRRGEYGDVCGPDSRVTSREAGPLVAHAVSRRPSNSRRNCSNWFQLGTVGATTSSRAPRNKPRPRGRSRRRRKRLERAALVGVTRRSRALMRLASVGNRASGTKSPADRERDTGRRRDARDRPPSGDREPGSSETPVSAVGREASRSQTRKGRPRARRGLHARTPISPPRRVDWMCANGRRSQAFARGIQRWLR